MHRLAVVHSIAGVFLLFTAPAAQPPAASADLVLINGKVLTVDADDRVAQGIAIAG